MPLVLADRVRDTTTTTGTGTVTLSGTAPTGYQNFSVIGNGNTTYYTINAGSQWEVGIGTYSSTGPTLARNTVLESSNANALVDFAAGTKDVFVTYPSDRSVYQDGASIAAGTAVLPVANGGTGVTTSTGTSSVVLSNSPTLVTPTLGAASATSIAAALGSVSAPSYTFTGDLNTGIYSPAADTLAFVEGGVEVMRITDTGNVGIGTSAPDSNLQISSAATARLRITTTGAATQSSLSLVTVGGSGSCELDQSGNMVFRALQASMFFDNFGASGSINFRTGGANTRMTITNTGDVGIGTTAPAAKLDVVGGGIRAVTTTTTSAGSPLGSQIYLGDANFASSFALRGPGIGAVFDAVQAVAASLAFYTYSSATRNERMRLDPSGNLGVNTTAPGTTFEVALSTSGSPGLRASRSGAQTQYIQMDIGGGASARLFATGGNKAMFITNNNSGAGLGTATDSTFIQVPGPSANTPITAIYIESSTANVGIGTTAPAGRVHATNTYTNTSNTNFIADGNIPGLNLRPANGRFSLLASYGAANTSSIVLGTGTANPSTEAMRFDHSTGGINVGAATPNAAAQLQVDSTTRGFLPPRMTTAQRDAIATPPNGLVLYNTSTDKLQVRAAGAWTDLH